MRYRMLTAAALLALVPAMQADAEVSTGSCAQLAKRIGQISDASAEFLKIAEVANLAPMIEASSGDLKAAAQRVEATRRELVPVLKEYINRSDDYAYQLKLCARG